MEINLANLEHLPKGSLTDLGDFLVLVDPGAVGEVILVYVPLLVRGNAGGAGLVVA